MAWGRPTKIAEFTKALEKILTSENVIALTDEDLVFLVNEELEEDERIHQSTFQKWKAWKVEDEEAGREFLRLYKKALIKEKTNLMSTMKTEEWQWQKTAWIIERKFDEWNIRMKTENNTNLSGSIDLWWILSQIQWTNTNS